MLILAASNNSHSYELLSLLNAIPVQPSPLSCSKDPSGQTHTDPSSVMRHPWPQLVALLLHGMISGKPRSTFHSVCVELQENEKSEIHAGDVEECGITAALLKFSSSGNTSLRSEPDFISRGENVMKAYFTCNRRFD